MGLLLAIKSKGSAPAFGVGTVSVGPGSPLATSGKVAAAEPTQTGWDRSYQSFGHSAKLAGQGRVLDDATMTTDHPQKITFGEMRASGVRDVLVYCRDHHCSHHVRISADFWPDHLRLSDIEDRFVCRVCGKRGADIRPDFPQGRMGTA